MPLPNIRLGFARQCECRSKRTGERCKNPAAFGTRACRYHGAYRQRRVLRGEDHPNYQHGEATNEARDEHSRAAARLHHLFDLGKAAGLYPAKDTIGRGRKSKFYKHLNPNDPTERALLLLKVL